MKILGTLWYSIGLFMLVLCIFAEIEHNSTDLIKNLIMYILDMCLGTYYWNKKQ